MSEESKEKIVGGKEIVEKRLKPSLIRRRTKVAPPPEQKEEAGPQEEAKAALEGPGPALRRPGQEALKEAAQTAEEKTASRPAGQPPTGTEKAAPQIGVVGYIGDVLPQMKEEWKDRVKKGPKRKKSREEMEMESIQRAGGLRQYAAEVFEEPQAEKPHAPVEERIFQPVASTRRKKAVRKEFKKTEITTPKAIKKVIRIEEGISVSGLSQAMGIKTSEIINKLMGLGIMAGINQSLDVDTATVVAAEYGYTIEHTAFKEEDVIAVPDAHGSALNLAHRPPVVTIMGHVDHGKTSLLDAIRQTNVVEKESGGITQHIGAYGVCLDKGSITFIDTPGHEAFTKMRARGAQVTDIVVLVVASDDGVMPQTIEAIDHAKAAEVPIIVAVNKIDLPQGKPDVVKKQLSERGLIPEEWGGETIFVSTSARTKEGIDKLLEMILLQAEVMELKADPTSRPKGIVIEAKLDKSRGPLATVLIQEGTLEIGNNVVCGLSSGRVRAMTDSQGSPCKEAIPSQAVEIVGLSQVPDAGDILVGVESEQGAKLVAELRNKKLRDLSLRKEARLSLEDLQTRMAEGELKELALIVKADVHGSCEAIIEALMKLSTDAVKVKIIHSGVGSVTEGDVLLAKASEAVIIGFHIVPDQIAEKTAEQEKVDIRTYKIIYDLVEDVKKAMQGLLAPTLVEKITGRAEVRQVFNISKVGTIAGCVVSSGSISRSASARLVRNQAVIFDGKISSLKHFKEDVREVNESYECGIGLENFNDVKEGDQIVAYVIEKKAAVL